MPRVLFPRLLVMLSLASVCVFAIDPRPKPTDYPSHAESERLAIGAEYLVHSFSNGSQMYNAPEYLIVDTAVFPHGTLDVKRSQFSLRVTLQEKKSDETVILHADAPTLVAYNVTSGLNAVPPQMRTPAGQGGRVPQPSDRTISSDAPPSAGSEEVSEVVTRMALPEDSIHGGEAGYLYFPFSGKVKKIKALDLVFSEGSNGENALVVKLF
jgi:hypothetical protein